jgi:hypothetical protein
MTVGDQQCWVGGHPHWSQNMWRTVMNSEHWLVKFKSCCMTNDNSEITNISCKSANILCFCLGFCEILQISKPFWEPKTVWKRLKEGAKSPALMKVSLFSIWCIVSDWTIKLETHLTVKLKLAVFHTLLATNCDHEVHKYVLRNWQNCHWQTAYKTVVSQFTGNNSTQHSQIAVWSTELKSTVRIWTKKEYGVPSSSSIDIIDEETESDEYECGS